MTSILVSGYCDFCGHEFDDAQGKEYRGKVYCDLCISFNFPNMDLHASSYTWGDKHIAVALVRIARHLGMKVKEAA